MKGKNIAKPKKKKKLAIKNEKLIHLKREKPGDRGKRKEMSAKSFLFFQIAEAPTQTHISFHVT